MEVRGEPQEAAAPQGTAASDDKRGVAAFDWLDALMALLAVYAVAALIFLAEVRFNGRLLAVSTIPVVLWAVRTRRRLFPRAARYVRGSFSLAGLFATLCIAFGCMFGAFGGFELFELSQARPAPVEQLHYDIAMQRRVASHSVRGIAGLNIELREVDVVEDDGTVTKRTLPEFVTPEQSSEAELQRFHAEVVAEVEAENLAEFEQDVAHKKKVILTLGGLAVFLLLAGGGLDAVRTRRAKVR